MVEEMKHDMAMQRPANGGTAAREDCDCGLRRVPLGMVQKTMAKRMVKSAREIPQFSVSRELDADALAARRARINADIDDETRRVSVTALLIWLTAGALVRHPRMNSQFDEAAAIQHDHVNMAVAVDTPYGLVAPVIHRAEELSAEETAVALSELAARAMEKRLAMNDFSDATFTISNLGMFEVSSFIPMVNPPQGAIMGVGAPRVAVRIAEEDELVPTDKIGPKAATRLLEEGRLIPARATEVTVTADHRILDGAEVARFLQTLAESIEE